MNRFLFLSALFLSACSREPAGIQITHEAPPKPAPVIVKPARIEPVFFNGKTYQLAMTPDAQGNYVIRISGMNAKQSKDANELTKTAFHHFTCKDSQSVNLSASPSFDGEKWISQARCA
jgi:hypothetical protein